MNHGELKVPSPFGRPSSDTQNLVLSELSLFIPPQNIENKILGLQYIGARLQYIGAPKCYWLISKGTSFGISFQKNTQGLVGGFVCSSSFYSNLEEDPSKEAVKVADLSTVFLFFQ